MSATGRAVMMALRSVEIRPQARCAAPRALGVRARRRARGSQRRTSRCSRRRSSPASPTTRRRRRLTVLGVPDRPGVAARVFRALADAGVNIDMIVQNVSAEGLTDISFTLPKTDLAAAEPILEAGCRRSARTASSRLGDREGLADRCGHEEPSRASPPTCSRRSGRGRDQHRDHLDVLDSHLLRRPRRRRRARGAGGAREVPLVRRGARRCLTADRVVGATGAVGTVTLRLLRERGYEQTCARSRLRGRPGRTLGGRLVVEEATPEALAAGDIDLCALLRRHVARRGSSCHTPCAAARSRSTSRRPTAWRMEFRSSSRR